MKTPTQKRLRNDRPNLDWSLAASDLQEASRYLQQAADRVLGAQACFADRERAMMLAGNEACRHAFIRELQAIEDARSEQLLKVNGTLYQRHQNNPVVYHSLCGPLRVERATYRLASVRNGPTIVPLELKAGLMAQATPALAYRVALGDAQCPGRQWEEQMHASLRNPPSRSTLERMAKEIGTAAKVAAPVIEPVLRIREELPVQAHAISLGLDRTSLPMEEPLAGPPDPRRRPRQKPYKRRKPHPIEVNYRMAYVGTVTVSDAAGEPLQTLRYSASADQGPSRVVASMMADLQHAQQSRPQRSALHVGITQDAAPELWSLMENALRDHGVLQWHSIVDRFHLTERLGLALNQLPFQTLRKQQLLDRWRFDLEHDDAAIDRIERYLATQARNYAQLCQTAHRPPAVMDYRLLKEQIAYIRNHKSKMRYASARALGLPTGSGTTEGACKSLVMIRAKRCGQRWHSRGVNSVLVLRAFYMSDRLPAFWEVFADRFVADIRAVA